MVLVTGGTGLVGSHLIMALIRARIPVRAIHRAASDLQAVEELFRTQFEDGSHTFEGIDWVQAELSDLSALDSAMQGVEEVYHCAGLISFDPRDRDQLLKVNWEGTQNLVNTALAHKVKAFCFTSTIGAIGGLNGLSKESDMWDPAHTNVYATSKYLAEMEVWRGGQEGLNIVIVNPGFILGPGFWERGSGRLLKSVAEGIRFYPPGGTGFIGIEDVVHSMVQLMERSAYGRRYILVAENASYQQVMQEIAVALDVRPPQRVLKPWHLEVLWRLDWLRSMLSGAPRRLSREVACGLKRQKAYDNTRIRDTLGIRFQPMQEVIRECAAAFRDAADTP